jgi:multidrug efflux system outer membrane protein
MRSIMIFCISLVLFASCKVGPKYERSELANQKKSYAQGQSNGDSLKLAQWFELYKDNGLQSLIKIALDNNPDLRVAIARVEEARFNAAIVRANLFPSIGYQLGAGTSSAQPNAEKAFVAQDRTFYNGALTLNWELDLFGRIRSGKSAAVNTYLQQEAIKRNVLVLLVAEIADNYFLLRDLDYRLEVSQRTVNSRKESLRINSERFNKGYSAEIDKLQADIQLATVEAAVPALQRQIVIVENLLNQLCGRTGGVIVRGLNNKDQQLPPSIPAGLPSQLIERRPDIQSAEFALKAQYDRVGVAQANRFPVISLTGALGMASPQLGTLLTGNSPYASVSGGLLGPVFAFNQNKRRVDVEKQRLQQLEASYDKVVLTSLLEVDNAIAGNFYLQSEFEARKRQVSAADKALTLSKQRYNFGYTSYLEVLIQENYLFDAKIQESITLRQKHSAIVSLYKALGGGW